MRNAKKTPMNLKPIFLLAAVALLLPACDSEPISDANEVDAADDSDDALRSSAWAKVVCTLGAHDRCYAKTSESPELLLPVVSRCALQARVDSGDLVPVSGGWYWACDPGGKPTTFEDVLCFGSGAPPVQCFGGSGGWYTEVEPSCRATEYVDPAWNATGCADNPDLGVHVYDSVNLSPNGPTWWARAVDGYDAVHVVQPCAIPEAVAAASPYECAWDGAQPCCSCDAEKLMTCVAFDANYECPAGTSSNLMTCQ